MCMTEEVYMESGKAKKTVNAAFADGHKAGKVSTGDVIRLYGCQCKWKG